MATEAPAAAGEAAETPSRRRPRARRLVTTLAGLLLLSLLIWFILQDRSSHVLPIRHMWDAPISFTKDGHYLATNTGRSDSVTLYDLRTGQEKPLTVQSSDPFYAYGTTCAAAAFSPDGKLLVNGGGRFGEKGSLHVWEVSSGRHLGAFALNKAVGPGMAFSPDGKLIATGGPGCVWLWDPANGALKREMRGTGGEVGSLAFSPDGNRIVCGGTVPTALIQSRDVETGKVVWSITAPNNIPLVTSVAFSPNGKTVACGNQYNMICLLDAGTGALTQTLRLPKELDAQAVPAPTIWERFFPFFRRGRPITDSTRSVVFSPDGKLLASGGNSMVALWDAQSGKFVRLLGGAAGPVAFTPDGKQLATGSAGRDPHVVLWDLR